MNRKIKLALAAALVAGTAWAATDTRSPLLNLLLMGAGLHPNDWGDQTNTNLVAVENAIEGHTSVSLLGGTRTLSTAEAGYQTFTFTGAIASDAIVAYPSPAKAFIASNATTGAHNLTLKCGTGHTVSLAQGISQQFYCDGAGGLFLATTPSADLTPVGAMLPFAGASAPGGNYALCDGSALSRTTYSGLYALIGSTYGDGDHVTTFNVPDARGRFMAALDGGTGRLNGWARGVTGGESAHTMTVAEIATHNHPVSDPGHNHAITDPGHKHTVGYSPVSASNYLASFTGLQVTGTIDTGTATTGITIQNHTTGLTVANNGSSTPFNVVPPTVVVNCIIRIQ